MLLNRKGKAPAFKGSTFRQSWFFKVLFFIFIGAEKLNCNCFPSLMGVGATILLKFTVWLLTRIKQVKVGSNSNSSYSICIN